MADGFSIFAPSEIPDPGPITDVERGWLQRRILWAEIQRSEALREGLHNTVAGLDRYLTEQRQYLAEREAGS